MNSGSLEMKDSIAPSMAFGGGALTFTPITIIQIVGAVVGVLGIVLGLFRYLEARRANDINDRRLAFEEMRYAETKNTENGQTDQKRQAYLRGESKETD